MAFRGMKATAYHRKYFSPFICCNCKLFYFVSATSRSPQPKGLYPIRSKAAFTCSKICSQKVHRMNPRLRKITKQNMKKISWEDYDGTA